MTAELFEPACFEDMLFSTAVILIFIVMNMLRLRDKMVD